jgi:hypothetical protein
MGARAAIATTAIVLVAAFVIMCVITKPRVMTHKASGRMKWKTLGVWSVIGFVMVGAVPMMFVSDGKQQGAIVPKQGGKPQQ